MPAYFQSWENPEVEPPRLLTAIRSWASRGIIHKAAVYTVFIACGVVIGIITIWWTLNAIVQFWIEVFSEEHRPFVTWHYLLGPLFLFAIIYSKGWLRLRLTEPRNWSRLKLLRRVTRLILQSFVGLHIGFASIPLIIWGNYWIGLIGLISAFATLAHRSVDIWLFDTYIVDSEPPSTRNDKLALGAIWSMSLIGTLLVSFYLLAVR